MNCWQRKHKMLYGLLLISAVACRVQPDNDRRMNHAQPFVYQNSEQHKREFDRGGSGVPGHQGFSDNTGLHHEVNYRVDHGRFTTRFRNNEHVMPSANPLSANIIPFGPSHFHSENQYERHARGRVFHNTGYASQHDSLRGTPESDRIISPSHPNFVSRENNAVHTRRWAPHCAIGVNEANSNRGVPNVQADHGRFRPEFRINEHAITSMNSPSGNMIHLGQPHFGQENQYARRARDRKVHNIGYSNAPTGISTGILQQPTGISSLNPRPDHVMSMMHPSYASGNNDLGHARGLVPANDNANSYVDRISGVMSSANSHVDPISGVISSANPYYAYINRNVRLERRRVTRTLHGMRNGTEYGHVIQLLLAGLSQNNRTNGQVGHGLGIQGLGGHSILGHIFGGKNGNGGGQNGNGGGQNGNGGGQNGNGGGQNGNGGGHVLGIDLQGLLGQSQSLLGHNKFGLGGNNLRNVTKNIFEGIFPSMS